MTTNIVHTENFSNASEQQKRERDLENLFEAEVEYVLDELQKNSLRIFGEEAGSVTDCAVEIGHRVAGIKPGTRHNRYWLRDMAIIVLQIMTVMETHGYKISEEVLEIMAQAKEDFQEAKSFVDERGRLAS